MSISHRELMKLAPSLHTPQSMVPSVWPYWAVTSHHCTRPRDAFINHVPSQLGGSTASCRVSPQSHLIHHPRSVRLQSHVHSNYPCARLLPEHQQAALPHPACPTSLWAGEREAEWKPHGKGLVVVLMLWEE